jgi:hypothetical protein
MKALFPINLLLVLGLLTAAGAPAQPALVFPPNNTINAGFAPPLKVRLSAPGGSNLTVRYYGRMAKSPAPDFTMVVMPDTQCYAAEINGGTKEMLISQIEWAVSNRLSRNIPYVAQLGDLVNNGDTPSYVSQWYNATNAMYRLENPARTQLPDGMAYGVAVGNHEQTPNGDAISGTTSNYNKYFGVPHFAGREYYAGHYGTNNNSHFDLFTSGGLDFIVLYFEYDATAPASLLTWANQVLATNANRRVIAITHYMGTATTPSSFSAQGASIYNALKSNTNLFLLLGGHVCGDGEGEGSRTDTYNGHVAHTLISDYQCRTKGGNGLMRLMEFSPTNSVVVVQTYSPWTGEYETDDHSEFYFPYTMPPSAPSGENFVLLNTQSGLASGALANFVWSGLLPYHTYEWYVTVTDEANNTVTSPTWTFTTASGVGARHDVAAGLLDASQIPGFSGADENTNCVVTRAFSVNDFRAGSYNRADYNIQIGPSGTQNSRQGVLLSCVTQNGRDNYGTNLFATSAVQTNADGSYRICTFASANTNGSTGSAFGYEYNMNAAGAWFPYATWIGGYIRNDPGTNGGVWNLLTGSAGLALGVNIGNTGTGQGVVDLRSLGIDSRTDGVLLVNHARDEANYALSQVNSNNGTWNIFVKDNSAYTANEYEQDPFAFVFIPRTATSVISGRFLADGTIDMYSGEAPLFTVTPLGTGRWELKITGRTPSEGALIISAEGGLTYNLDNIVSYEVNADGDGWEIQSRDTPKNGLQTPSAWESVVSFVYVPALPAGISISPANNFVTVESGATATFNVMLDTAPTGSVSIAVASSDITEGTVSPATLVFTTNDWHVPKTVTIQGVDDAVLDGDIPYQVTLTVSSTDSNYNARPLAPLAVVNLDNEPRMTVTSNQVPYGIGMPGIALDGQARLVDPATPNYGGASLTFALTANATDDDRLSIRNVGTGAGQISISGNSVRFGGTLIGTFTGGVGATPLVVAFNTAATPSAVQALLRVVTFSNVSNNPSLLTRSIGVTLRKADGIVALGSTSVRVGLLRVARFQQGWDYGYGVYTSASDCELSVSDPNSPMTTGHSDNSAIWMDAPAAGATNEGSQALLRFDKIAGNSLGQIPTNAVIVSAELRLTMSPDISNSSGDGSPLYRMLVSWNPNSVTWNNAGNGSGGFRPDNVYARSNYDSFLGLTGGEGATGNGTVGLGVTADIAAWVNGGEANYGWLMPGWQPPDAAAARTDGTAFCASEWAEDPAARPYLQVLWLPPAVGAASFRQGVNGYSGTQDTRIRQGAPNTPYATATALYSDWDAADTSEILIRFDGIGGSGAGQVPAGARVDAATLDLSCSVADGMGDGGRFFRILRSWQDSTATWNSWGNGVQNDGIEAASTASFAAGSPALEPNVPGSNQSFDLTDDVQAWVRGVSTNYGWAIVPWPNGSDAWGFASAEAALERDRPRLRVFYTTPTSSDVRLLAPVRTSSQVQVRFAGIVGTSCAVERASALGGGWTTLGKVTVGQDGVATFTDTTPLPQVAFYRVKFP